MDSTTFTTDTTSGKRPASSDDSPDEPAFKRHRPDPTWDDLLVGREPWHSIHGLTDVVCLEVRGICATMRGNYLGEVREFYWEFKRESLPKRHQQRQKGPDGHRARAKRTISKPAVLDEHDQQHLSAVITYLDTLKKAQRAIVNRGNKEAIAIWRTSGVPLDQLRAALDAHQEFERVLLQLEVERAINNKAQADLKAREAEIQILRAENHELKTENRELEEQLRR